MVALHAVDGGAVGVRTGVRGAGTHRWFPRAGAQRPADLVEGTGFDHELLLRAELVPGAEQRTPEQVTAPQAASLPAGRLRARRVVRLGNGRQVTVALVRVGGGFVLDMVVGGRRTARIGVPDFVPEGGRLLKFEVGPNPGEDQTFGVYLEHVNFDSTRVHRHYYGGDPGQFTFIN
jgi:hypothetical protein